MKLRDWVEIIGILAVVLSLVFVGLQLRQTQEIALAEGYSMVFASRIEVSDSIAQHADIWRKGAGGEPLGKSEATIFAILVTELNDSAIQAFTHVGQVTGVDLALVNARDFAGFLYRNPGARAVWSRREEGLATYRGLLRGAALTGTQWPEIVQGYLKELDELHPNVEETPYPYW